MSLGTVHKKFAKVDKNWNEGRGLVKVDVNWIQKKVLDIST